MTKPKKKRNKKGRRLFDKWIPSGTDIRKIFELFFQPLFKHVSISDEVMDGQTAMSHRFDFLLGKKFREIPLFRAKRSFNLPGYKIERGGARVVENAIVRSERQVQENAHLLIRFDERAPEFIDVQYWNNHWDKGGDERVFRLNSPEWNFIREHLEEIDE